MGSGRSDSLPIPPERRDPIGFSQRRSSGHDLIRSSRVCEPCRGTAERPFAPVDDDRRRKPDAVREPDGTLRKLLTGWDARLTPTGHLLFSRRRARHGPSPPRHSMRRRRASPARSRYCRRVPVRYATPAAASAAGDLFYIAGSPRSDRRVVIVDRLGQNATFGCRKAPGSGRPRHPTVCAWRSAAGKALDEPSGR